MPESSTAFPRVKFLVSAGIAGGLPPPDAPELAFAGRSNVGKSSAINALTNRRRLAFFSKTPGRTQTINFFDLSGRGRLVDLPGYGYARVPQAVRAQWDQLVGGYMESRDVLVGIVLLTDARRPFTPHDQYLLEWLHPAGRRLLVLLAKCDKVARGERDAALRSARERLATRHPDAQALLFSSRSGEGVEAARTLLDGWLQAARKA